jgi:ABC-2 type transport system permease protein
LSTAIRAAAADEIAPTRAPLRPSFAGAVRGEILKVVRQRATWVMVGFAILLLAIVFGAFATEPNMKANLERDPAGWYGLRLNVFTAVFNAGAGIFLLILTSRLVAMEYSAGTIRVLLGRGTGRLQLLGAKLLTAAGVGLALLVVFTLAAAVYVYGTVVALQGSFSSIAGVPSAWHDLGLSMLVALISIVVNILLATAAAVVGRSLAFGLGAALAFYPADNFGTIVMSLLNRLTNQHIWNDVTAYLLGPNLNVLGTKLIPGQRAAFAQPLVSVDTTHVLVVIGVYAAAFLAASIVLTVRRDVLQ